MKDPRLRELRTIRILLAIIVIAVGLYLTGAFNGGEEHRTVVVHFHSYGYAE